VIILVINVEEGHGWIEGGERGSIAWSIRRVTSRSSASSTLPANREEKPPSEEEKEEEEEDS